MWHLAVRAVGSEWHIKNGCPSLRTCSARFSRAQSAQRAKAKRAVSFLSFRIGVEDDVERWDGGGFEIAIHEEALPVFGDVVGV